MTATPENISTLEYARERVDLLTIAMDKLEATFNQRLADIDSNRAIAVRGIDERFNHMERLNILTTDNAKRAVDKAEAAQTAHNTASNEWRGTLNDFKTTLVGREEFQRLDRDFSAYRLEIAQIIAAQAATKETRGERKDDAKFWTQNGIAIIAAIIGLIALLYRPAPATPNIVYVPAPTTAPTPH